MTEDELEQQLRAHYRTIDPGRATGDVSRRIADSMDRRVSRPVVIGRARPALAAAIAVVLIIGIGLGLRPGGFLSTGEASPSPSVSPSGPLPAVSAAAWTGIRLESLDAGPVRPSSVTMWSGGYVALGESTDTTPFQAWTSRDGRNWTALPADTFGEVGGALAAAIPGGVVVVVQDTTGKSRVYRSTDGTTWIANPAPQLSVSVSDVLASNGNGVVGIVSPGVAFSADAITWEALPLPGTTASQVAGVAAFGSGFVAVGVTGTGQRSPAAWWSSDGLHWTSSTVETHAGDTDGFVAVYAAKDGLVAISSTGLVPGLNSLWSSSDGQVWRLSADNPLRVVQQGEGLGSMNGIFSGDGTRLLVYGTRATDQPTEYWNSVDATHWTKLAVTGQTTVVSIADDPPFLLRDGILFSGNTGEWFGAALP